MRQVPYPKPGEILLEEFLKPMGISAYRLAKEIGVPQMRISEIVAGKRAITVDTGLRLSRYFGLNDGFWTGLQLDHDSVLARDTLSEVLANIKPLQFAPMVTSNSPACGHPNSPRQDDLIMGYWRPRE